MMDIVKTIPAIQWYSTQANLTPTFGRKAVNRSANMAIAMIRWNRRAPSECLATRSGIRAATRELEIECSPECAAAGFAQNLTYIAWPITNNKPPIADTHRRLQAMWMGTC